MTLIDPTYQKLKSEISAGSITDFPASWYYFGSIAKVKSGIVKADIGSFRLMAMQGKDGKWKIMQRNCLHMGADLSKGKLDEQGLHCPMHGWLYTREGNLEKKKACLKTYPSEERNKHLFVFLGPDSFYYPFPLAINKDLIFPKSTLQFTISIPWFLLSGNGFDINHFETVHERKFVQVPQVQEQESSKIRILHRFQNTGNRWVNRILRKLIGKDMQLDYSVYRGNCIHAISKTKGMQNQMLFFIHPLPQGGALVYLFPLIKPGFLNQLPVVATVLSGIRNYFIRRFFQDEIDSIQELSFIPESLEESDFVFMQFIHWIQQQTHAHSS